MILQKTQNLTPFDPALNEAVVNIAHQLVPEFVVEKAAPSTYQQLKAHLNGGKTLVIAQEGSDNTIFGAPAINHAFRAWHDWCHWKGEFDFSLYGECATCSMQIDHLRKFFGVNDQTNDWACLLAAEIVGQRRYYEKYRIYVSDQRAFARAYLTDKDFALSRHW